MANVKQIGHNRLPWGTGKPLLQGIQAQDGINEYEGA